MTLAHDRISQHDDRGGGADDDPRFDPAYHVTTGALCAFVAVLGALACGFARRAGLSLEHTVGGLVVGLALPLAIGHLGVAAVLLLRAWRQRRPRGPQAAAYHHHHHPHRRSMRHRDPW